VWWADAYQGPRYRDAAAAYLAAWSVARSHRLKRGVVTGRLRCWLTVEATVADTVELRTWLTSHGSRARRIRFGAE